MEQLLFSSVGYMNLDEVNHGRRVGLSSLKYAQFDALNY